MQHHVTGVKVHSLNKSFIYTWTDLFHPDANITINCLVDVLHEICKENGGSMPPTLYLQADNSAKDNKNGFMMMFLAWLIKEKVFRKIKFSFLMVGHTHEDVDQLFSRISTHMARNDAHTLPQLLHNIEQSTTPAPVVQHLKAVYDYKSVMAGARGLIEGITGPHVFKFEETDGGIRMGYKDWPREAEDYRFLDVSQCTAPLLNVGNVQVNKKIEETVLKMQNDLKKWAESGRLSNEEVLWWTRYLSTCQQETRLCPNVQKACCLGHFRVPPVNSSEDVTNLVSAVEKNVSREKKKSILRLKKRKN